MRKLSPKADRTSVWAMSRSDSLSSPGSAIDTSTTTSHDATAGIWRTVATRNSVHQAVGPVAGIDQRGRPRRLRVGSVLALARRSLRSGALIVVGECIRRWRWGPL